MNLLRKTLKDGTENDAAARFIAAETARRNREAKARTKAHRSRLMVRSLHYKREYGICLKDFRKLLNEQRNRCFICQCLANDDGVVIETGKLLVVDHDHKTGDVRGLLCHHCNSGIGMFRDNPQSLTRAIEYLAPFTTKS